MMRKALLAVTLGTLLAGSVGCHRNTRERAEDSAERTGDKIENTAERAGEKTKDAVEKAGDKIEDATDN
ncbi:MAG: YtxH domain-containing protein [Cystobacter sp.]